MKILFLVTSIYLLQVVFGKPTEDSEYTEIYQNWNELFGINPKEYETGFHDITKVSAFSEIHNLDELIEFLVKKEKEHEKIKYTSGIIHNGEPDETLTTEKFMILSAVYPVEDEAAISSSLTLNLTDDEKIDSVLLSKRQSYHGTMDFSELESLLSISIKKTSNKTVLTIQEAARPES